jgi:hypothetical protein
MAPNRADCLEEYKVSIKQVGNPIDLHLLRSLREFYESGNNNDINSKDIHSIKQVLSLALHENCSSRADFIYNRSFFSQPASENAHDCWDLGLGKALWRGFYSCLVFSKGHHQLLMNLDGKYKILYYKFIFLYYMILTVSHAIFMKKQPFINFLCEVMLHSPRGKWQYGRNPGMRTAEIDDILNFLNPNLNVGYYDGEVEFLLEHCKRKYLF